MIKLHATILSTLLCTTQILSMIDSGIISAPEKFPDLKTMALCWSIENADKYITDVKTEAKPFICSISLINRQYYNYVNDPIITRITINNLAKTHELKKRWNIAKYLATPGAKNYLIYSKLLHKKYLTKDDCDYFIKNRGTQQELDYLKTLSLDKQLIELCVSKGGDVNCFHSFGYNPLFQSLIAGFFHEGISIKTVELSLQLGVEINLTSNPIVRSAIELDAPGIIHLLYKHNKKVVNKQEKQLDLTALLHTFLRRNKPNCNMRANDKIIKLLVKNDYTLEEALHTAIVTLNKDLVEKFISKGADPRKIDISFLVKYIHESYIAANHKSQSLSQSNQYTQDKHKIALNILKLMILHGADKDEAVKMMRDAFSY